VPGPAPGGCAAGRYTSGSAAATTSRAASAVADTLGIESAGARSAVGTGPWACRISTTMSTGNTPLTTTIATNRLGAPNNMTNPAARARHAAAPLPRCSRGSDGVAR